MTDMLQEHTYETGPFTAWSSADGMHAEVRAGSLVMTRFLGETAWSDAVREAEDRNLEHRMSLRWDAP